MPKPRGLPAATGIVAGAEASGAATWAGSRGRYCSLLYAWVEVDLAKNNWFNDAARAKMFKIIRTHLPDYGFEGQTASQKKFEGCLMTMNCFDDGKFESFSSCSIAQNLCSNICSVKCSLLMCDFCFLKDRLRNRLIWCLFSMIKFGYLIYRWCLFARYVNRKFY